jgi:acetyl/propionyl-CoA carboxylase alpha subunit
MIAKLIVWAPTRPHAILRMRRALEEYRIVGVHTNVPFHLGVMQSIDFQRGRLDTRFVERFLSGAGRMKGDDQEALAEVAALAAALVEDRRKLAGAAAVTTTPGASGDRPQPATSNWRLAARRAALR